MKNYLLTAADGFTYESNLPGELGGNSSTEVYGQLDCSAAIRALPRCYAKRRVFFSDEAAAIVAGYRPCGACMRERYKEWNAGGTSGTAAYSWSVTPK